MSMMPSRSVSTTWSSQHTLLKIHTCNIMMIDDEENMDGFNPKKYE